MVYLLSYLDYIINIYTITSIICFNISLCVRKYESETLIIIEVKIKNK